MFWNYGLCCFILSNYKEFKLEVWQKQFIGFIKNSKESLYGNNMWVIKMEVIFFCEFMWLV